jgi:cytochrome P450
MTSLASWSALTSLELKVKNIDAPISDLELYSDEVLASPYETYAELRDLGPVVYMSKYDAYAVPRYHALREVATNWEIFSSAKGVMMNDTMNELTEGVVLCSDPPEHRTMREVLERPLRPGRLDAYAPQIREEAAAVVSRLVDQGSFDAATDLAQHLPLTIVSKLVGLGDYGRERMLEWASAGFDAQGPMNPRTIAAMPKAKELVEYALNEARPGKIDPDGWAADLYRAGERGELPADKCPFMVIDYTGPSLDTTIFGTSSAIWLFAHHPDQWALLREQPALIRHAINEVLRLESPIQYFTRLTTKDHEIEGINVPAGSRTILMYGSANRDERKYPDPDKFDISRRPSDQLAFGHGEHACVGMNLARLEIRSLLEELVKHVHGFEILSEERAINNTLRGLARLDIRVHPVGVTV